MKRTKKLITLLLALLALTACQKDEPIGQEYFQNMKPCPTKGVYEGVITPLPITDNTFPDIGVWCRITKAPEDAAELGAPVPLCCVYFLRSDFGYDYDDEDEDVVNILVNYNKVKFRILEYGDVPESFPFQYAVNYRYYICKVKPK